MSRKIILMAASILMKEIQSWSLFPFFENEAPYMMDSTPDDPVCRTDEVHEAEEIDLQIIYQKDLFKEKMGFAFDRNKYYQTEFSLSKSRANAWSNDFETKSNMFYCGLRKCELMKYDCLSPYSGTIFK